MRKFLSIRYFQGFQHPCSTIVEDVEAGIEANI